MQISRRFMIDAITPVVATTTSVPMHGFLVVGVALVVRGVVGWVAWAVVEWRKAQRDEHCEEVKATIARIESEKEVRLAEIATSTQVKLAEIAAATQVRLEEIAKEQSLSAIDKVNAHHQEGDVNLRIGDLEVVFKAKPSAVSRTASVPKTKTEKKLDCTTRSPGPALPS